MSSEVWWKAGTECPLDGFQVFSMALTWASFHNAGEGMEYQPGSAKVQVTKAVEIAIDKGWPYWAMERMFKEIKPLVEWGEFMQSYINCLRDRHAPD